MADKLQVQESVHSKGFGIVGKVVMKDRDLAVGAKALYSYICSYAGAGETAFPGRSLICYDLNIGKDTYSKYLRQLKQKDYIRVEQQIKNDGTFGSNTYTIMLIPQPEEAKTPCTEKSDTDSPDTDSSDTNNNSIKSNSITNNSKNNNNDKRVENTKLSKGQEKAPAIQKTVVVDQEEVDALTAELTSRLYVTTEEAQQASNTILKDYSYELAMGKVANLEIKATTGKIDNLIGLWKHVCKEDIPAPIKVGKSKNGKGNPGSNKKGSNEPDKYAEIYVT